MADERRYVVVVSPAYVKPILDGSKVVIVYPGAGQEQLEDMRAAVEDLKAKPREDLYMLTIKPDSVNVEWVPVRKVREIRSE